MWYSDLNKFGKNGCAEFVIHFPVIDYTGLNGLLYMCIEKEQGWKQRKGSLKNNPLQQLIPPQCTLTVNKAIIIEFLWNK